MHFSQCVDPVVSIESWAEFTLCTSVRLRDLWNLLAEGTKSRSPLTLCWLISLRAWWDTVETNSYLSILFLLACSNPTDKSKDKICFHNWLLCTPVTLIFVSHCHAHSHSTYFLPLTSFNLFQLFKSPSWWNNDAAKLWASRFDPKPIFKMPCPHSGPFVELSKWKGPHYDSGMYRKSIINKTGGVEEGW